jgi:ubiquitin carboxyl-terminal hydrolase 8
VDAQDAAGKWYEALVEDVTEDSVTVHYFGWASKWNGNIRRRRVGDVEGVSVKIHAPAPLWSHSSRWREKMADGKILEVRDASSHVNRPKWYKGIVRRIAIRGEKLKPVIGGAVLELFEIPKAQQNGNKNKDKRPLLLLGRKLQALVEIEQERQSQTQAPSATASAKAASASLDDTESVETFQAQPPFLRWVQLFGEEVCEAGTHMKIEPDEDLAVVTLRYEFEQGRKPVEIMKSWNNMYGSGFMKESLRGSPPAPGSVGMHNLGNSCFLNSIIQCLNHMDQITHYFLKGNYQQDLNRRNPLGSGGHVATAYSALMREIWGGKFSALAPRLLKQTVAMFAPQFNNSYQHDSQEFCQFLMDGLHEDCNRVKEKPYVEELEGFGMEDEKAAIETWRKHLLRHDSIIVDHCQGMHRSHLTCPGCGRESIKFDVFSTISLPLAREKGHSSIRLEDCIEKFMEGEQLDELNAWYCPSCKKHVCALKMIALWSVPDILILHLKRFTFDQCAISNEVVRSKIDDTVKFPIEGLDLRKHVLGKFDENAPPIYRVSNSICTDLPVVACRQVLPCC